MPKQPKLNYNAEWQDSIPVASDVSVDPPEDYQGARDYIPPSGNPLPPNHPRKVKQQKAPQVRLDPEYGDYVPKSVVDNREKSRKNELKRTVRRLWEESKPDRDRWMIAKKMVETATDEQLADPTPDLEDAKRIYDEGCPMTPEQAVERARGIIAGQVTSRYG